MEVKAQINEWVKTRLELLENGNDSKVSELTQKIRESLKENFDSLECDFTLETLTHLGNAPSVLYDDNGMWAVCGDGTQPAVCGDDRLEGFVGMGFFFEKEYWHNTIRAALRYYLFAGE